MTEKIDELRIEIGSYKSMLNLKDSSDDILRDIAASGSQSFFENGV